MNDDDSPVCSACRQMDQRYRPGPTEVRDALHASDQDHAHLSPHRRPVQRFNFGSGISGWKVSFAT
jgi:hypothetical protein